LCSHRLQIQAIRCGSTVCPGEHTKASWLTSSEGLVDSGRIDRCSSLFQASYGSFDCGSRSQRSQLFHSHRVHELLEPNFLEFVKTIIALVDYTNALKLFDSIKMFGGYAANIHTPFGREPVNCRRQGSQQLP